MIQYNDEAIQALSELLKGTAYLEDMFPKDGNERISDNILFALTLGEAIGVVKACKQLGCENCDVLKSDLTCSEMTIAKGRGSLMWNIHKCEEKIISRMREAVRGLTDCLQMGENIGFDIKKGANAHLALLFTYHTSKAIEIYRILTITPLSTSNKELVKEFELLKDLIRKVKPIQDKIIKSTHLAMRRSKRGRPKSKIGVSK